MAIWRLAVEAEDLESLWGWLCAEPELQGRLNQQHTRAPAGSMGAPLEIAVAALGVAATLAASLSRWLVERERQRRVEVSISITTPDGGHLEIKSGGDPLDTDVLRRAIEAYRVVGTAIDGGD